MSTSNAHGLVGPKTRGKPVITNMVEYENEASCSNKFIKCLTYQWLVLNGHINYSCLCLTRRY